MGCGSAADPIYVSYRWKADTSSSSTQAGQDSENFNCVRASRNNSYLHQIASPQLCASVEEHYVASLFYALVLDIMEDIMSFNFLAATSKAIYACHISIAKMKIKNECVLSLRMHLDMDAPVVWT